jgi:outer membrane protein TolC
MSTVQALPQTIDITMFLDKVRDNNKDIILAMKELEIAEENVTETSSGALPYIEATGKYNRNFIEGYLYVDMPNPMTGESMNQKFTITYDNEFSFQTVVSQQIFNATIFTAIEAAKQYEELTGHIYDATYQGVIAGSKKAFYMTLLLKEVYDVRKSAEENAKDNYDWVKDKYDNGLASQFELYQAEVRWKNTIPQSTQAERNYKIALNSIKRLAGIPPETEITLKGELSTFYNEPEKLELTDVLNNRPDFNAMLWEKTLLETNIEVERSSYYPSAYLSLAYQWESKANRWAFDNQNNYLIGGLTVSIPIFQGFRRSAKVQKAIIEKEKAEVKIRKAKEEIAEELENIHLRIKEAKNRILSAETTLNTGKKAFDIAETSANNGLATQLELKDVRLAYDQAKLNMIMAVYDYLEACFDWELATGNVQ